MTAWAGTPPRWWARYLGTGGHAAEPLTAREAWLIHAHQIAIALVANDVDPTQLATRQQGLDAAASEVAQARALGVPHLTTLYADIEHDWPLTGQWLVGWTQGAMSAGYSPGVYLDPADTAVQHALSDAREADPAVIAHLSIWAASWLRSEWTAVREVDGHSRISTPPWIQIPPSEDATQVGLWQFAGPSCGGVVDVDLMDPSARPAPVLWTP